MNKEKLQSEYHEVWKSFLEGNFSEAKPFSLEKYLSKAYKSANKQAENLMPIHLHMLEKITSCMILLSRFMGEKKMSIQSAAFLSQLHRATNCLIAIRLLFVNGFEETSRPITRNYIESIDISVACVVDKEFSHLLSGNESADFNTLWNKKIGYGKIYNYVELACELAGFSKEEIKEHIRLRKAQKTLLSASVHGDDSGAFRSMAPPPLGYPDMLSTEPHGVVSFHTANHAAGVISETYKYLSLILKIIISGNMPDAFNLPKKGKNMHSFFSHFFAFQEMYQRYDLPDGEEIVAPGYTSES